MNRAAQTRDELICMAMSVLRSIRDVARITHNEAVQHLAMRFRVTHGLSIVTGAVDAITPEDGWLVRWEIDPSRLQGDPSRVTTLAVLLVDAALQALDARRAKEPT